jgi:hypothetical protein
MPLEPSDDELDVLIETRLRLVGVDLGQLPATVSDPVTGSPSRQEALEYLRSVLRETSVVLASWVPPEPPPLAQQVAPPALYPSNTHAWTERGLDE